MSEGVCPCTPTLSLYERGDGLVAANTEMREDYRDPAAQLEHLSFIAHKLVLSSGHGAFTLTLLSQVARQDLVLDI